MSFKVIYASAVYDDIQQAVDFYHSRKKGLGLRFYKTVKIRISLITTNAFAFQIRYADVRCPPCLSSHIPFITDYTKCKSKSVQTHSGIMPMNRNVKFNRVSDPD